MTTDELIARLEAAWGMAVPALGCIAMCVMLVVYPKVMIGLKDVSSVCAMLFLGAGHLAALRCCSAALRARASERGHDA